MNDLVSIDQTNDDSFRILDRNYSSSTNDSKIITPGSCVTSPPIKSNLKTQDINKLYDHYYPNIEDKESITENSVDEDLNENENIGTMPRLPNDIGNNSPNNPEVFKLKTILVREESTIKISEEERIYQHNSFKDSYEGNLLHRPYKFRFFSSS